ncbi:protein toll-like isoform X2 [Pectinophora gossypiella]|uniref:protein toll-like isoform X2 n=1 Tax=Pectinophora gossypiella TaxID=13191 RepID=UPI00214EC7A7|nr:protein toll-like isoform X2 [Pectinophora gossypiella]
MRRRPPAATTTTKPDDNFVISSSQRYVNVQCVPGMSLDSASLPRFHQRLVVSTVALHRCAPPGVAYAALLARLNVTVLDTLQLTGLPAATLRADHLEGLSKLEKLDMLAADVGRPAAAHAALLRATPALTQLRVSGVRLAAAALQQLPSSLSSLRLQEAGLTALPGATLGALPRLRLLELEDRALRQPPELRAAPALRQLVLTALNMQGTLLPGALDQVTLKLGPGARLAGECRLRQLTLISDSVSAVPSAWLANCSRLNNLTLRLRNLTALTGREFSNLTELQRLTLSGSPQLQDLPQGLFDDTRNLTVLNLSNNSITRLPSNIFSRLRRLRVLDLSHNALAAQSEEALSPLSALETTLQSLVLSHNPLGDLCAPTSTIISGDQWSWLPSLSSLQTLRLVSTGAARLCPAWRLLRALRTLDLRDNALHTLRWNDLQWPASKQVDSTRVLLTGTTLRYIQLQRAQYDSLHETASGGTPRVKFELKGARLRCDCTMYWFARARQEKLLPVSFNALECAAPRDNGTVAIDDFGVDNMVCGVRAGCPRPCSCWWRPRDGRTVLQCSGRGLRALPPVSCAGAGSLELELRADNNSISSLPAALPACLRHVDLRGNLLSTAPAAQAAALLGADRTLRLAGNPLQCRCGAPLLASLAAHLPQLRDAAAVRCADGSSLAAAARDACALSRALLWSAAGAVLALLGAAAAATLLRRHVRLRLKAALLARGLCLRWAAPVDDLHCTYDAFLSYSHLDSEVADAIVRELESGARPLRLCVHHRDWRVGDWIHAQIAESVARSRRTVILLSENFAQSSWARAEFREAYARALSDVSARLIVVLLGAAPPPGLDPELQHYIAHNTYVRWGEPAFWEKLRLALPPGKRSNAAAAKASGAPTTAPATPNTAPAARAPRRPPPAPLHMTRSRPPPAAPAPPTPVIKFSQIEFPAPLKPPKNETSACA